jgi:hypothetical protein
MEYTISNDQIETIMDQCNRINGLISIIDNEGFVTEIKTMPKGIADTLKAIKKGG